MTIDPFFPSRRRLIGRSAACLVLSIGACGMRAAIATTSSSGGKASKSDFFYQDQPKDGKSCSNCRLFTAADGGRGSCALLAGEISANGWCMGYSPRG